MVANLLYSSHICQPAFYQSRGGDGRRRREVQEILRIMASKRGTPHLLMGDFNAIAPGDRLKASALLRYLIIMDQQYRRNPHEDFGHPNLDSVVPEPLRFLYPLLQTIIRSKLLCALLDKTGSLYARRGSISMLRKAWLYRLLSIEESKGPGIYLSSSLSCRSHRLHFCQPGTCRTSFCMLCSYRRQWITW